VGKSSLIPGPQTKAASLWEKPGREKARREGGPSHFEKRARLGGKEHLWIRRGSQLHFRLDLHGLRRFRGDGLDFREPAEQVLNLPLLMRRW